MRQRDASWRQFLSNQRWSAYGKLLVNYYSKIPQDPEEIYDLRTLSQYVAHPVIWSQADFSPGGFSHNAEILPITGAVGFHLATLASVSAMNYRHASRLAKARERTGRAGDSPAQLDFPKQR